MDNWKCKHSGQKGSTLQHELTFIVQQLYSFEACKHFYLLHIPDIGIFIWSKKIICTCVSAGLKIFNIEDLDQTQYLTVKTGTWTNNISTITQNKNIGTGTPIKNIGTSTMNKSLGPKKTQTDHQEPTPRYQCILLQAGCGNHQTSPNGLEQERFRDLRLLSLLPGGPCFVSAWPSFPELYLRSSMPGNNSRTCTCYFWKDIF